jgi:hypothetical protein
VASRLKGRQMTEVKINLPNGTQFDAQMDALPRVGDRLLISTNMGTPENSYTVTNVDFHLNGPMMYTVSSITVGAK